LGFGPNTGGCRGIVAFSCTKEKGFAMKNVALALLLVVAVGLLSACGTSSSQSSTKITVAYILGTNSDPFYTSMACGARAEAQTLGITINIQGGPQWGVSTQTPIVNSVTASHPNAMVVVPNDSKAMIAPIQSAANAGIKIVLADTTLDDTSFVSSRVSSDNVALGAASADALAQQIGDSGEVVVLGNQPGVSTVDDRIKGFNQEIASKYPQITVVDEPVTTGSVSGDTQQLTAEFAKHPNLVGVMAVSGAGIASVSSAISQANAQGKIKVVSFDTTPTEVQDLQQGIVQALIGQEPYVIGQDAVQQAVYAVQGKSTQSFVATGAVTVTAQNLNDPNVAKYLYKTSC
jgi:ribose transport system substrate-binding protein